MNSLQERTASIISNGAGGISWPQYEAARFLYAAVNHYAGRIDDTAVAAHCVWQLLCGEPVPDHELCKFYPYSVPKNDVYAIASVIVHEYIPQDVPFARMSPVIDEVHLATGTSGLRALFDDKRAAVLFHVCYPEHGFDVWAAAADGEAGILDGCDS